MENKFGSAGIIPCPAVFKPEYWIDNLRFNAEAVHMAPSPPSFGTSTSSGAALHEMYKGMNDSHIGGGHRGTVCKGARDDC